MKCVQRTTQTAAGITLRLFPSYSLPLMSVSRAAKRISFRGNALRALDLGEELRRLAAIAHAVIANDAHPAVAQLSNPPSPTGVHLPAASASRQVTRSRSLPGL